MKVRATIDIEYEIPFPVGAPEEGAKEVLRIECETLEKAISAHIDRLKVITIDIAEERLLFRIG